MHKVTVIATIDTLIFISSRCKIKWIIVILIRNWTLSIHLVQGLVTHYRNKESRVLPLCKVIYIYYIISLEGNEICLFQVFFQQSAFPFWSIFVRRASDFCTASADWTYSKSKQPITGCCPLLWGGIVSLQLDNNF